MKSIPNRSPKPPPWRLCDSPRPGDGLSPQELKRRHAAKSGHASHGQHRSRQLCKAVERSLAGALSCDCGDPLLKELRVVAVSPAPRAVGVLEVTLGAPGDGSNLPARLKRAAGLLRSVLASEIQRKRVPRLRFRLIPWIE